MQGSFHQDHLELLKAFGSVDVLFLAVAEVFGANKLAEYLNVVPRLTDFRPQIFGKLSNLALNVFTISSGLEPLLLELCSVVPFR